MSKQEIIKEEYDYEFLDHEYWKSYNIDPLWFCIINEQFDCIRDAFDSLDENSKNILNYFVIRRLKLNNIDIDLDKYLDELRYNYLYYYEKYYKLDEE